RQVAETTARNLEPGEDAASRARRDRIIANAIGKGGMKTGHVEERLPLYGVQLFSGPIIPKFACYVDADGYPVIFPCFQARAIERKQIVFPLTQFKDELLKFKKADKLAFLAIDTESRSLLVKGTFLGFKKSRGITYGQVDIDQVYNSMPPTPGLVYPALEVRPKIEKFAL
nr:hypothetical protein [Candidatus Sigynarchaeota archaeon]